MFAGQCDLLDIEKIALSKRRFHSQIVLLKGVPILLDRQLVSTIGSAIQNPGTD